MRESLLAAAGHGKRYFGHDDPFGKAFIELGGKPLLHYITRELRQAGIERLVIAANEENFGRFKILEKDFEIFIYIDRELKGPFCYPYVLEGRLPYQYHMLYGHQPVSADHLIAQDMVSDADSIVASFYKKYGEKFRVPAKLGIDSTVTFVERESEGEGFIGGPFIIIGPQMSRIVKDDNFQHKPAYYIKKAAESGTSINELSS
ncbi:NTP transferase domain-containing protein [Candidatus Woesearchaeota archaeon]|nr:NTP transferase domain-containing protein [Candidatus Woesearchaeota archaeon]